VAAVWRSDRRSRWRRHVLRGRRDERALELQLPAVQSQRDSDGRRDNVPTRTLADFYQGVPFGTAVGTVRMDSTTARGEGGTRSALEHRLSTGAAPPHNARDQLRGDQRLASAAGGEHQPAAAGPGSVQARRPYPRFGNLSVNTQAMSSRYDALQAKLQKRLSDGFWYLVSYTLLVEPTGRCRRRKSAATTSTKKAQRCPTRHTCFAFSSGYALPFARNNRLLGGWQVQTIINFRSGLPFTPTISRDVANDGVANQRPNRIGSGTSGQSDDRPMVRQGGVRRARPVHVRQFRRRHPARGPSMERRRVAVQAVRDARWENESSCGPKRSTC